MSRNIFAKENRGLIKIIIALAWPTMLEQLMQTAVQYIDTAMVGSLGTYATAAVGATSTVNWLLGSSTSALAIGFLSYIARACGANDREAARKSVSQAVLTVLVAGAFFTVVSLGSAHLFPSGCRWKHRCRRCPLSISLYFMYP